MQAYSLGQPTVSGIELEVQVFDQLCSIAKEDNAGPSALICPLE